MIQYIYFVKCPGCEDEHFDFFDEAKEFALGCLSQKPIITQTEVCRNDFGECTDHCDLGTVWSWEDMMKETEAEPTKFIFTRDDLKDYTPDCDPEFDSIDNSVDFEVAEPVTSEVSAIDEIPDNFRKPIPEGMTIEQLVEEMEENEDEVECALCQELFAKSDCYYDEDEGYICPECKENTVKCTWCGMHFDPSECRKEVDLGWLCSRCEAAIKSRGETLTFREGSYWDFLDEDIELAEDLTEASLTDIAAAANSEFGSFYDDDYLLDAAGVADDLRDLRGGNAVTSEKPTNKIVDDHADIKKDAKRYIKIGRADLYNKKYRYFIEHFDDVPAIDPETNELVYDEAKKKAIIDLVYTARYAAMEKSREAVKRAREKAAMKKKALKATVNEEITAERSVEELVRDSIHHLINDLGKDSFAEDFVDDVILDIERNYDNFVPEEPMNYRKWASAIACEVSRQLNKSESMEPASTLETLEEAADYRKRLALCPECGDEHSYDRETGFCLNCGFN